MKTLLLFLLIISTNCVGQKQGNIWYFGDKAGVDFNSGNPVPLLNGQLTFPTGESHNEGSSSISDTSGAILFYSDGMTVWNRNHQIMQNGTGLLGNFTSTQSSLIVPDPNSPNNLFYLFTASSGFYRGSMTDGLRYSKIDMCLDSARGGVIDTIKNILLIDTIAEKIAVTRHANGIDYWILTHRFYSNEFWAFHLSNSGISDTIVTAIGSVHSGNIAGSQGQLKFSPDGNRLAIAASNGLNLLEVFSFDKTSGSISNFLALDKPNNNNASIYGVEFSPDNSKLYASGVSSLGTMYPFLAQYNLTAGGGSLSSINSSMIEIYHNTGAGFVGGKGLQLAPNGKIYWISLGINNPLGTLATVNYPNLVGQNCGYQDQVVSLGGRTGSYSLPSFISGYDYSNKLTDCSLVGISKIPEEEELTISPNPFTESARIKFANNKSRSFTLTLYSIDGQPVKIINYLNEKEILLERNNLPSGIYFYQIKFDGQHFVNGKIILK